MLLTKVVNCNSINKSSQFQKWILRSSFSIFAFKSYCSFEAIMRFFVIALNLVISYFLTYFPTKIHMTVTFLSTNITNIINLSQYSYTSLTIYQPCRSSRPARPPFFNKFSMPNHDKIDWKTKTWQTQQLFNSSWPRILRLKLYWQI